MTPNSPAGLSTVLVHQGSPGGIGQVETLLDRAFRSFGGRTTVMRRNVAGILDSHPTVARPASKSRFGFRVLRTVALSRPDMVVFTHLNLLLLALAVRIACPSSRIAYVAHGIEAWSPLGPSAQAGMRAVDAVWCVSEFTRGMLQRESDVPARKLQVLPLALTDDKVRLIESHGDRRPHGNSTPLELLSVTRLHPADRRKGIEHVLLSLAEVHSANPNFHYRLVGDGADRPALIKLAGDLGLRGKVAATGELDDDSLARALGTCDAFILPSAKEGFGLAHLEAMCAAKPVIASHAGATPEVVDDASGILIRYGDTEGLADAILRLMNDESLCATLGASGRSRFRNHFTEASFQTRLRHLLELL
jgi:phosphatidylinositol alpha-1,6-mannosyltransferase